MRQNGPSATREATNRAREISPRHASTLDVSQNASGILVSATEPRSGLSRLRSDSGQGRREACQAEIASGRLAPSLRLDGPDPHREFDHRNRAALNGAGVQNGDPSCRPRSRPASRCARNAEKISVSARPTASPASTFMTLCGSTPKRGHHPFAKREHRRRLSPDTHTLPGRPSTAAQAFSSPAIETLGASPPRRTPAMDSLLSRSPAPTAAIDSPVGRQMASWHSLTRLSADRWPDGTH